MIVGTGNVGASIAYALVNQRTAVSELVLTDLNAADAEGEQMDLSDALAVAPSYLKIQTATNYAAARDCDICILTAGANQKPGETRTDLLKKNALITKEIVTDIMASGFKGIFLVVANPVDILTRVTLEVSGLAPEQVIGSGTVLDSARLRHELATVLDIHPKSIHAYQIGEHGDSELTVWSAATVGGVQLTKLLSARRREAISDFVRNTAYKIIEKKGSTHYGISNCVVQIVNCILGDEHRVLAVSNYDDCNDAYYGFPAVVGRSGILRRINLDLNETEGIKLQESINTIKRNFNTVKKELK